MCSVMWACALKQFLFGELLTVRPCHELHRRDVIVRDVPGAYPEGGFSKTVLDYQSSGLGA